jgi:hypothetical protein
MFICADAFPGRSRRLFLIFSEQVPCPLRNGQQSRFLAIHLDQVGKVFENCAKALRNLSGCIVLQAEAAGLGPFRLLFLSFGIVFITLLVPAICGGCF